MTRAGPAHPAQSAADAADRIVGLYDRHAHEFDCDRVRNLFERPWLDRFLALIPQGGSILDVGCGPGDPIARYFIETGCKVTGADSSPAMIDLCRRRFPDETWIVSDMRRLSLARQFEGVLAWDSFFHLRDDDQRNMFRVFQRHTCPGAALMFNSGPRHGEAIGSYRGEPLFHASLDPAEYRLLLEQHAFHVVAYAEEDPSCGGRTVWLAQRRA